MKNRHLSKKPLYYKLRGFDVAKAKGPMKKHALEFFFISNETEVYYCCDHSPHI